VGVGESQRTSSCGYRGALVIREVVEIGHSTALTHALVNAVKALASTLTKTDPFVLKKGDPQDAQVLHSDAGGGLMLGAMAGDRRAG